MPRGIYKRKKMTDATKKKISLSLLGHSVSQKTKDAVSNANKLRNVSGETRQKMSGARTGSKNHFYGKHHSNEIKELLSKARQGSKLSSGTKIKISNALNGKPKTKEHRQKLSLVKKGENSVFWKGGITPINECIRKSFEFRLWREAVFARDNWTCQECMVRGGILHPHHIKPFALYPNLRFVIANGQTLCIKCHKKTKSWGRQPKQQVKELCSK